MLHNVFQNMQKMYALFIGAGSRQPFYINNLKMR